MSRWDKEGGWFPFGFFLIPSAYADGTDSSAARLLTFDEAGWVSRLGFSLSHRALEFNERFECLSVTTRLKPGVNEMRNSWVGTVAFEAKAAC